MKRIYRKAYALATLTLVSAVSLTVAPAGAQEDASSTGYIRTSTPGTAWDGINFQGLPAEAVLTTWARDVLGAEVRLGLSAGESSVENLKHPSGQDSSYYAVSQPVYKQGNGGQEVLGVLTTFRYLQRPASAGAQAQLSAPIAHPASSLLEAKRVVGYLRTPQQLFRLDRTGDVSGYDELRTVGESSSEQFRSGSRSLTSSPS